MKKSKYNRQYVAYTSQIFSKIVAVTKFDFFNHEYDDLEWNSVNPSRTRTRERFFVFGDVVCPVGTQTVRAAGNFDSQV